MFHPAVPLGGDSTSTDSRLRHLSSAFVSAKQMIKVFPHRSLGGSGPRQLCSRKQNSAQVKTSPLSWQCFAEQRDVLVVVAQVWTRCWSQRSAALLLGER